MTKDQERVNTSKFNIRQALNSVGVDVPVDTPLDEYPPYIMGLSSSGLPPIMPESEIVVFPAQTLSFGDEGGGTYIYLSENEISLIDGETYIVVWDGTNYTCVASVGEDEAFLGNPHILRSVNPDTGEPFVLDYYFGEEPVEFALYTTSTSASHTIKISQSVAQTPPNGAIPTVKNGEWVCEIPSAAGLGLDFKIPITYTDSSWTCELTSVEIEEAYESGKRLILDTGDREYYLARAEISNNSPTELMWIAMHFTEGVWLDCYMLSLNSIDPTIPPTVQFESTALS